MSDIGEGMIFVGQILDDWKKGDFSKAFKSCGACGCVLVSAGAALVSAILVFAIVVWRSQ